MRYAVILPVLLLAGCSSNAPQPRPGSVLGVEALLPDPPVINEDFSGSPIFPPDNWWNLDISTAPVDPQSAAFIGWIGAGDQVHPDFGPVPYGIPYVGVSGDEALVQPEFIWWPEESDFGAPGGPAGYPIPDEARTTAGFIEGGTAGGGPDGDRHLSLVDRDNWILFETYATTWDPSEMLWKAGNGAVFDLSTNDRRPEGWTSADAAGLAVFPGLVKYDEAYGPAPITHAFRMTVHATNGHVWPASHTAGSTGSAPPMGARFRLKASVDISGYPAPVQKIFQAMKTYGLIVADNGSDMYVSGTMDDRWDNDILNPAFHGLHAGDFEVIELGWNPQTTGVPE